MKSWKGPSFLSFAQNTARLKISFFGTSSGGKQRLNNYLLKYSDSGNELYYSFYCFQLIILRKNTETLILNLTGDLISVRQSKWEVLMLWTKLEKMTLIKLMKEGIWRKTTICSFTIRLICYLYGKNPKIWQGGFLVAILLKSGVTKGNFSVSVGNYGKPLNLKLFGRFSCWIWALHKTLLTSEDSSDRIESYHPKVAGFEDFLNTFRENASERVESLAKIYLPFEVEMHIF